MATHRKSTARGTDGTAVEAGDVNMRAAGLLFDMAAVQTTEGRRFGYKRAAQAIAGVSASVVELVENGVLADVSLLGPASSRIVTEVVTGGSSPTVEAAVAGSPRRKDVLKMRALRDGFLSHHALEHILSRRLVPSIVGRRGYGGDLQMHSTWSDGAESIASMAEACLGRGHAFMGVTDHSHGLPVAGGMSMTDAARQQEEIERLNSAYAGRFRIFHGIEANILADGALDLAPDERAAFEYVVAAPHGQLRRTEDQTSRMLAAVGARGVAILGHPRGRMFHRRAGVVADWPRVFRAAAARDVAIELDGNWHRQDLDWTLAAQALDAGCLFALDSDAHSTEELRFSAYAVAHARLARVPAERVINYWSEARLKDWMDSRRGA